MLPSILYYIHLKTIDGSHEEIEFASLEIAKEAYEIYKADDYFTTVKMTAYDFNEHTEEVIC